MLIGVIIAKIFYKRNDDISKAQNEVESFLDSFTKHAINDERLPRIFKRSSGKSILGLFGFFALAASAFAAYKHGDTIAASIMAIICIAIAIMAYKTNNKTGLIYEIAPDRLKVINGSNLMIDEAFSGIQYNIKTRQYRRMLFGVVPVSNDYMIEKFTIQANSKIVDINFAGLRDSKIFLGTIISKLKNAKKINETTQQANQLAHSENQGQAINKNNNTAQNNSQQASQTNQFMQVCYSIIIKSGDQSVAELSKIVNQNRAMTVAALRYLQNAIPSQQDSKKKDAMLLIYRNLRQAMMNNDSDDVNT